MHDYKQLTWAVKALVVQINEYDYDKSEGTFSCTINGKPFKVNYKKGSRLGLVSLNVYLGDEYYLFTNIYTDSISDFQIYYKDLKLLYTFGEVYIRTGDSKYLPISTPDVPREDYLQVIYYYKLHTLSELKKAAKR